MSVQKKSQKCPEQLEVKLLQVLLMSPQPDMFKWLIWSLKNMLVEHKQDVVILLDSITRWEEHNSVQPASGKILTGGVDSNALERPKRFLGCS